ncbi:MAG: hypothetical protein UT97_C0027G0001, partial [Parcubacteria group bacterium GW2011_GWC2_40_31]
MRAVKIKTRNFIILFFSLLLTLAVFSQLKAASPKPVYEVGFDKQEWFYSKAEKGISAYLGKKGSSVPTVRYQKDKHFLEFSMNQVSSSTAVSLETNAKEPNTPTLFYRNVAEDIDAAYKITNLPFKVKEEIILKSQISNLKSKNLNSKQENLTFLFNANTNAIPVKQPDGSIYFYDNQNNYLFQIDKPFMIDGKGTVSNDVGIEIVPVESSSSYKVKDNNFQFPTRLPDGQVSNFQSIFNNPIFKQITSSFSLLKIKYQTTSDVVWYTTYSITLSASSDWLNDPSRVYPVIIDPTITHNTDANFSGEKNRIADADSTSNTQLESSYPEATLDPYTVLLLHFNEANGTTSGIKDYASTTRVITANGNASTTSYVTQLGLGNSAAFDGTSDYLSVPDSEDWNFGSGDFSIEMWIRFNTISSSQMILDQDGAGNARMYIYFSTTNGLSFRFANSATTVDANQGNTSGWTTGIWYHLVVIRNRSNINVYRDNVSIASNTISIAGDDMAATLEIGRNSVGAGEEINGNLDSVRIIKGRALTAEEIKAAASRRPYAVYTSPVLDASASAQWDTLNWTEGGVRTGDGEQPYNTNSLVAQWNFNDTSGTTLTASSSGSCTAACNGTLTNFAYTASQDQATTTTGWTANNKKWGAGALMFESVNAPDYVSISDPASNALDPGTGDFSAEGWIKSSAAGQDTIFQNNTTVGACAANAGYILIVNGNKNLAAYASDGTTCFVNNLTANASSTEIADGRWHHFAFVADRDTKAYVYYDGRLATSTSINNTTAANPAATIYMGASGATGDSDFILDSLRYYSRALSAAEILSNYQAGNIEIQTRTGATSDPNDGSWEAWKPTTGETQLLSMDSDAANWHSDIMASTTIATSTELTLKMEGAGSLKLEMGKASSTVNTGTVALWHFEETGTSTGTYLYDETANNNDATTSAATVSVADGIFGKARRFSGGSVDDLAKVTTVTGLPTGASSRSIGFWAWVDPGAATDANFAFAYGGGAAGGRFGVAAYPGANWWFQGNGAGDLNTGVAVILGKWTNVVVTYDGTTLKFYIDGALVASAARTLDTASSSFYFGNSNGLTEGMKGVLDELFISNRVLSPDEIAETYRMGANHHLTRQVSSTDLSGANKLPFYVAADRPGTYLEAMIGESDFANYELASSTLALSTATVLYIKGDEIASSTNIKDSSFSGKTITANGNARTAGGGKIGNSVYFDGTGDYLSVPDSADWDFGTGNFSVDFWAYNQDLTTDSVVVGNWSNTG